jgi:hypothetical protein
MSADDCSKVLAQMQTLEELKNKKTGDDVKRWTIYSASSRRDDVEVVLASDHDRIVAKHVKAIQTTDERWRKATDQLLEELATANEKIAKLRAELAALK